MKDSSPCSTEMSLFERDPPFHLSLTTTIHLWHFGKKMNVKKSEQEEQERGNAEDDPGGESNPSIDCICPC